MTRDTKTMLIRLSEQTQLELPPATTEDGSEKICQCRFCREFCLLNASIKRKDIDELIRLLNYFSECFWTESEELEMIKYHQEQKEQRDKEIKELLD
jgi:hypothetical protein